MEELSSLFNNQPYNSEINQQGFDERKDCMLDFLPFNTQENDYHFNNVFNFDYKSSFFGNNKYEKPDELNTKQIIDKLNSFEDNYFKKIVVEEDKIQVIETNSNVSFKSNLMIAEKTLPGIIISYMHQRGEHVSEDEVLEYVKPKFNNLRKTNGAIYQVKKLTKEYKRNV